MSIHPHTAQEKPGVAAPGQRHVQIDQTNRTPLSQVQLGGGKMRFDRERKARNIRREAARPLAFSITQGEWVRRTQGAMRDHVGPGPGGAKKLAAILECSEATAKNYLEGRNAPSGILDLRALNAVPEYAALKREIAAMEMTLDPRLQAKLIELVRMSHELGNDLFESGE